MIRQAREKPREIFISHASEDAADAKKIATILQAHGIRPWLGSEELRGGDKWHKEIGDALYRCDWFAVLLSPPAVASTWVKREVCFALGHHDEIVPILLQQCDFLREFWSLHGHQRVDFAKSFEDGCRELLAIWGIQYQRKSRQRQL